MRHHLSHAGRRMLDRRDFLQWGGTGLSSIALATLLHEQRLLGGEPPIRPLIDPAHPYAPRQPHFPAKAKRVEREAGSDPGLQVGRAIELAFGRKATEAEVTAGRALVAAHGLPILCRSLYNASEFITIY